MNRLIATSDRNNGTTEIFMLALRTANKVICMDVIFIENAHGSRRMALKCKHNVLLILLATHRSSYGGQDVLTLKMNP